MLPGEGGWEYQDIRNLLFCGKGKGFLNVMHSFIQKCKERKNDVAAYSRRRTLRNGF
jgi:hypothetical protein